ncbi:MAG: hypothetical protein GKR89_16365 [Candidatus Latescibacteria bacterium]|nr:hypothetical protein [Candidatus Latescibacterota bacterium]
MRDNDRGLWRCNSLPGTKALVQALLLLALVACHDTDRDNPLDPQLTPAVELAITLDETTGTATLTWTPYQGDIPFAEYQVLRNITDRIAVDTLATFTDIGTLAFTDTTLTTNATYVYRLVALNSAGFAALSRPESVGPLHLPAIAQLRAEFNSGTASASLVWSPYRGPRFSAYQVLRRITNTEQIVAQLNAIEDTTFIDIGLNGATHYTYQIVVRTERDELLAGASASGGIHHLIDTWLFDETLPIFSDGKLYFTDGEILALMPRDGRESFRHSGGRLLRYNKDGQLLSSQWLAPGESVWSERVPNRDGQVWLLGGWLGADSYGLQAIDRNGQMIVKTHDLFTDELTEPFTGDQAIVLGNIGIGAPQQRLNPRVVMTFGNLRVMSGNETLYRDFTPQTQTLDSGWSLAIADDALRILPTGPDLLLPGWLRWNEHQPLNFLRRTADWNDFQLQVDVKLGSDGAAGIEMGGATFSRFTLGLVSDPQQQAQLDWTFVAADGSQTIERSYSQPFPFLHEGTYRLILAAEQGQVRARIETPVLWAIKRGGERVVKGSMADLGGSMAVAIDEYAYHVDAAGNGEFIGELQSRVERLKVWQRNGQRFIGAVMPEIGTIVWGGLIGSTPGIWPDFFRRTFGPHINPGNSALENPFSFAVGPDGQFYVLDGGNARVVVFDAEGNYLTQWGRQGAGAGEFDFDSGTTFSTAKVYFGDIAVDDEGFVYVLDKYERIQKFAP